jgi:hypothetical protein
MIITLAKTPTRGRAPLNRRNLLQHLRQRTGSSEKAAAKVSPNPRRRDGRVSDQPHRGQMCFAATSLNLQLPICGRGVVEKGLDILYPRPNNPEGIEFGYSRCRLPHTCPASVDRTRLVTFPARIRPMGEGPSAASQGPLLLAHRTADRPGVARFCWAGRMDFRCPFCEAELPDVVVPDECPACRAALPAEFVASLERELPGFDRNRKIGGSKDVRSASAKPD